ncbi:uncharacterized protein A1O5_12565 [Cladophialophora psammophila CBS 110553]|uniref:Heterokaryon incompatibility domain-containing protein n=1 Tax=Cladophialophora psammophila CBS 110553 TaxID=1182543 RepID=W9VLA0_9EURO|nr:uncharacterized protein A1O5_12565 [Cladophialophora psammophila CBS 110553]EXJ56298.1 hypothetical protein A1O5_12565 [Cladophialophora psammophila CBS 110553]
MDQKRPGKPDATSRCLSVSCGHPAGYRLASCGKWSIFLKTEVSFRPSQDNCTIPHATTTKDDKTCSITFFFQSYPETASSSKAQMRIENQGFTWLATDDNAIPEPYTGRLRPLVANLSLFQRWKEACQNIHGSKCSQIFRGTPKISPRVIDVHQRCLVQAREIDTWVCLSYVWGTTNTTRLLQSNLHTLLTPGSLSATVLPPIVEDALQVTRGLGEQYLWVDSLCIMQDHAADKTKFVSQMDSIYALATVVIIAATCIDANSHLPGVRPHSRQQKQEVFNVRNLSLLQSLDPVTGMKVDLRTGRAAAYLGTTVWDTRAWTLQERFLAARSLVFTAEQVFWECEEAFWCEDSFREFPHILPDPHRTSLCRGELNLSWNSDYITFDHYYRVLLGEYSTRALKYDSDALNAFSGIIRAFERSMGLEFFWGMPCAFLESALSWGNRALTPRPHRGDSTSNGHPKSPVFFPSWSWVGWKSDGSTKIDNQNLTMAPLGVEFYRLSDDGKAMKHLKQVGRFSDKVDLLAEGSSIPDRSSRATDVSRDSLPSPSNNTQVNLSSVLCFWTASTHVTIAFEDRSSASLGSRDGESSAGWGTTISQGTTYMEAAWFHPPTLGPGETRKTVEVIAIAQNRGDWDGGHINNGAIGIMVISWKDGIASREGFAWIAILDWAALKDRVWKLIVLG